MASCWLISYVFRPYRTPELLFGEQSYDPPALDLWAVGATLAEFFTPLELVEEEEEDYPSSEESEAEESNGKGFIYHNGAVLSAYSIWNRKALFDSSRGDLGLAWSIFQLKGTPNTQTWPGFARLPHAQKLTFNDTPGVPLASRLPHLPDQSALAGSESASRGVDRGFLDLITALLQYPPQDRLCAAEALSSACFTSQPILLPEEAQLSRSQPKASICATWEGYRLGELVDLFLSLPHKPSRHSWED